MFARILGLLLSIRLVNADCTAQQSANLYECYVPLLSHYNIAVRPDRQLPAFSDVQATMDARMTALGMAGVYDMCNATMPLNACINATAGGLPDVDCLGSISPSRPDAYNYLEMIAVSNYECTDGLKTLYTDWYCLKAVQQHSAVLIQRDIQRCYDALNEELKDGKPKCPAYDKYISCVSLIYARGCDYNCGVLFCNVLSVALDSVYNVCEMRGQLTPCPHYK